MGRIDVEKKIQETVRKRRQADALLKQLRGRQAEIERKARERKIWLIGDAVLKATESNSELRSQIQALMDAALVSDRDRARFGLDPKEENDVNER